jgi:hypothetical protein
VLRCRAVQVRAKPSLNEGKVLSPFPQVARHVFRVTSAVETDPETAEEWQRYRVTVGLNTSPPACHRLAGGVDVR